MQVNRGGGGLQINIFGTADAGAVRPATPREFRDDVAELISWLDAEAIRGHLPIYMPVDADITAMTRTVQTFTDVRKPGPQAAAGREQVYVPPSGQNRPGNERREPWDQVAARHERLMVLADPGMGKSWLIRTETHKLAQVAHESVERFLVMDQVLIPIPVRADALASSPGQSLAEAVASYLVGLGALAPRSESLMREQIRRGGAVLLIDALDEVPREAQDAGGVAPLRRLEELLRRWADECTGVARCVLTSRLAGYSGPPIPGMGEKELLPFSDDDVKAAILAWGLAGSGAARIDELLKKPAISGMARIPLLLALLCSLAADGPSDQPLPDSRTSLYEAVLWRFLSGAHRTSEIGSRVSAATPEERQRLLHVLAHVAYTFATTRQGWIDRLSYADAVAAVGNALRDRPITGASPADLLSQLEGRAGVLVPAGNPAHGEQPYVFLHRTIAEYLVARYLSQLDAGERMRVVRAHVWFDPDWQEVIPMLGGLLAAHRPAEAAELVAYLVNRRTDPLWRGLRTAIRILGETSAPDRLLPAAEAARLGARIERLCAKEATWEILCDDIAELPVWPSAIASSVLRLFRHRFHDVRSDAIWLLGERREDDVIDALLELTEDKSVWVSGSAAQALANCSDPRVPGVLLRLAAYSSDDEFNTERLRGEVGAALSKQRGVDPRLTDALVSLLVKGEMDPRVAVSLHGPLSSDQVHALLAALSASNGTVRACAAIALRDKESPEVTAAILTAAADEDGSVRQAVAESLRNRHQPDEIQVLRGLLRDREERVRRAAVESLNGYQGPDAPGLLMEMLSDESAAVRAAAAASLARVDGVTVTERLLDSLSSGDYRVRDAAAESLRRRDEPGIAPALIQLLQDGSSDVRSAAVKSLKGQGGPEVTDVLISLLEDGDKKIRAEAAAALGGANDKRAVGALLRCLKARSWSIRSGAVISLYSHSDPAILSVLCRRRTWQLKFEMRRDCFELADHMADRTYLQLPPAARKHAWRGLAALTRSVSGPLDMERILESLFDRL